MASRASHEAVKAIIIAVGGIIGTVNVLAASRMNKKVVVFVLQESMVAIVVESGLSRARHFHSSFSA